MHIIAGQFHLSCNVLNFFTWFSFIESHFLSILCAHFHVNNIAHLITLQEGFEIGIPKRFNYKLDKPPIL